MNKVFEELARRAGFIERTNPTEQIDGSALDDPRLEEFAKLILAEVLNKADDIFSGNSLVDAHEVYPVLEEIAKHFEVSL